MSDARHHVIYDGDCPMCTFQMRLLTWMDWLRKTSLIPISHPSVRVLAPDLSREALSAAIHCISRQGQVYRGARCIRFVSMRMPLLVPLGLFLWVPGVIWVAERVYAWVSTNRYILSRLFGCKEACRILPPRTRDREDSFSDPKP